MTHTPTPWHAPGMGEIHDEDHNLIAHIAFSTGEHDDDQVGTEDDAKFIVRAVNSHDELVRRLAWAVKFIETYASKAAGPATPEIKKCKAALDAAGEQS